MGNMSQPTPSQTTGKYLVELRAEASPFSSWCGHHLGTRGETWLCALPREVRVGWRNYLINLPFRWFHSLHSHDPCVLGTASEGGSMVTPLQQQGN